MFTPYNASVPESTINPSAVKKLLSDLFKVDKEESECLPLITTQYPDGSAVQIYHFPKAPQAYFVIEETKDGKRSLYVFDKDNQAVPMYNIEH